MGGVYTSQKRADIIEAQWRRHMYREEGGIAQRLSRFGTLRVKLVMECPGRCEGGGEIEVVWPQREAESELLGGRERERSRFVPRFGHPTVHCRQPASKD